MNFIPGPHLDGDGFPVIAEVSTHERPVSTTPSAATRSPAPSRSTSPALTSSRRERSEARRAAGPGRSPASGRATRGDPASHGPSNGPRAPWPGEQERESRLPHRRDRAAQPACSDRHQQTHTKPPRPRPCTRRRNWHERPGPGEARHARPGPRMKFAQSTALTRRPTGPGSNGKQKERSRHQGVERSTSPARRLVPGQCSHSTHPPSSAAATRCGRSRFPIGGRRW